MFTADALDDHPQTILSNRKRLMAQGHLPIEQVIAAADVYRHYLLEHYGLKLDRNRVITQCEQLPR